MIVGVLLAAGASTRMGAPKSLVRQGGESFLAHGIRHLWTACNLVVVVLGSNASSIRKGVEEEFERLVRTGRLHRDLQHAHRQGAAGLEVRFVMNGDWKSGMFSSVRFGLKQALRLNPEGLVLLPVDHPAVKPTTVVDLVAVLRLALKACKSSAERKGFSYALVPRFRRHRGHPVAVSPALARMVAGDAGAQNLSDAVRRNARLLGFLDVTDPGVVRNRNRPGD